MIEPLILVYGVVFIVIVIIVNLIFFDFFTRSMKKNKTIDKIKFFANKFNYKQHRKYFLNDAVFYVFLGICTTYILTCFINFNFLYSNWNLPEIIFFIIYNVSFFIALGITYADGDLPSQSNMRLMLNSIWCTFLILFIFISVIFSFLTSINYFNWYFSIRGIVILIIAGISYLFGSDIKNFIKDKINNWKKINEEFEKLYNKEVEQNSDINYDEIFEEYTEPIVYATYIFEEIRKSRELITQHPDFPEFQKLIERWLIEKYPKKYIEILENDENSRKIINDLLRNNPIFNIHKAVKKLNLFVDTSLDEFTSITILRGILIHLYKKD